MLTNKDGKKPLHSVSIDISSQELVGHDDLFTKNQLRNVAQQRTIVVEFDSKETKAEYIKKETFYTQKQLRKYNQAWTTKERVRARVELYAARRVFHDMYITDLIMEPQTA